MLVGDHLTVSDGVYVRVGDHDAVDVVPTSLSDALDKPASDLRKTQLFETASPSVQQFTDHAQRWQPTGAGEEGFEMDRC